MLGSLISPRKWQWMARGKHPGLKDYFSIGADSPLLTAFCDWIEKGYRGLTEHVHPSGRRMAWRFWMGGHKPGVVLCGIVKDSSDSVGRPYPLMILGMGDLHGWEKVWSSLPGACDKTWTAMEAIATRVSRELKELQTEVQHLGAPVLDDLAHGVAMRQRGPDEEDRTEFTPSSLTEIARKELDEGAAFVPIGGAVPGEESTAVAALMRVLATALPDIPKAVFLGGPPDRPMVAVFRRPLQPQDFTRLWTA